MNARQDRETLARTVAMLCKRVPFGSAAADRAHELHALSRKLHRWAERQCNEDLTCPECSGEGVAPAADKPCRRCVGRGHTLGRREAKAEARAQEIASMYALRCYFQGDPRGCPVYLIPEEGIPADRDKLEFLTYDWERKAGPLPTLEALQRRWIASNYNSRGVAVCHLGR